MKRCWPAFRVDVTPALAPGAALNGYVRGNEGRRRQAAPLHAQQRDHPVCVERLLACRFLDGNKRHEYPRKSFPTRQVGREKEDILLLLWQKHQMKHLSSATRIVCKIGNTTLS